MPEIITRNAPKFNRGQHVQGDKLRAAISNPEGFARVVGNRLTSGLGWEVEIQTYDGDVGFILERDLLPVVVVGPESELNLGELPEASPGF